MANEDYDGLMEQRKKLAQKPIPVTVPQDKPLMTRGIPIAGNNVLKRAISRRIGGENAKKKAEALA